MAQMTQVGTSRGTTTRADSCCPKLFSEALRVLALRPDDASHSTCTAQTSEILYIDFKDHAAVSSRHSSRKRRRKSP